MPYGLTNATSVFQSFIDEVFRDMLGRCVVVYIDNMLVYYSQATFLPCQVYFGEADRASPVRQGGEVPFLSAGGLLPGLSDIHHGSGDGRAEGQCNTVVACSIQHKCGVALPTFGQLVQVLH